MAACRGVPTEIFFSDEPSLKQHACELCGRCPVSQACRAYADAFDCDGVWGGVSVREQRLVA